VDVLERGVHSGSASGVVPSSFRIMRQLLDRLEDPTTGEIVVPELRVDVPEAHRRAAELLTSEFGDVAAIDLPLVDGLSPMGETPAARELNRTWAPTLSVTGVSGIPDAHEAGNVLRPFTSLVLSFRLPPSVDSRRAADALQRTLLASPPSGATITVKTDPADGWLAPPNPPWLSAALDDASRRAFGRAPGYCGEGGTIPFLAVLGAKFPSVQFVATGVLGPSSNAHGIDEMLDLPMFVAVTNAVADVVGLYASQAAR
jgi:acetylornithine deacetylase/succinyl-diaminopimelate desuccinylase-like protein